MADVNETIGGYRLRSLLQTGQKSQVFEVVEPDSNRHFAMKVLLPEAAEDEEQRAILFHEAAIGIKLKHENVINIVKVNKRRRRRTSSWSIFPSGSLRLRLQAKDAGFIKEHARKIFKEAATGLAYMNANGLHPPRREAGQHPGEPARRHQDHRLRHLQEVPEGVPASGSAAAASRRARRASCRPSRSATRFSTAGRTSTATAAPCTSSPPAARRSAAGTTNDLLTKHLTEKAATPAAYNPDLTDEFCNLVLRMLAKDKKDRPLNFHEVLMELKKIRYLQIGR